MIKGKSPEEIRRILNLEYDFTPEEEDQIRRENEWAEDLNELSEDTTRRGTAQNDFTPEEEDQIRRENEWDEELLEDTTRRGTAHNFSASFMNIKLGHRVIGKFKVWLRSS
jgi:hypothetical protein